MANLKGDFKAIMIGFIGVIVAVVFIASISNTISLQTTTQSNLNQTVTAPAVNGTLDLIGRELVGSATVVNSTSGAVLPSANLTVSNQIGSIGLLTVQLTTNDAGADYAGAPVNVSYNYLADGALTGGANAIQKTVLIFAALAILVFIIVMFMEEGSLGKLMGRK